MAKDDHFVLVNSRTGYGLTSNTITQEVHILAKAAKMEDQTCPHMFRHRYITKIFAALIEQHMFETLDEFRRALFSTYSIKQKVLQLTGHRNVETLDIYIHLAFDELSSFKKAYNSVRINQIIDSFKISLAEYSRGSKLRNDAPTSALTLFELIDRVNIDLDASRSD